MVDFTHRDQAEPLYRSWLQELNDETLQRELRIRLHLLKTTTPGPYTEDLWRRDCFKDEFERRGRMDLYENFSST